MKSAQKSRSGTPMQTIQTVLRTACQKNGSFWNMYL